MVYDAARDEIVLFGGWNNGEYADTWVWNGSDWLQLFPAHALLGQGEKRFAGIGIGFPAMDLRHAHRAPAP